MALGAIVSGCYDLLKPQAQIICQFLIEDMKHPKKFVRAISTWTLSRLDKFIFIDNLSDNYDELLKDYISEILLCFLDEEPIVQESSLSAMIHIFQTKENIEPFVHDILRIINHILEKYSGNSLLNLYDLIILMSKTYGNKFDDQELVNQLISIIMIKFQIETRNQSSNEIIHIISVLTSLMKCASKIFEDSKIDLINKSLEIVNDNAKGHFFNDCVMDRELVCKCIDLMIVTIEKLPSFSKDKFNTIKVIDFLFTVITFDKEMQIKHYVLALLSHLISIDVFEVKEKFDSICVNLINLINYPAKFEDPMDSMNDHIAICNNASWALSLLALKHSNKISIYVEPIVHRVKIILSANRLNKSLAQNLSILLGRLCLAYPKKMSRHLDSFLKQFCLSLRFTNDSNEKQEAFTGLCNSVIQNPNGVINHFAFFCDAICHYDNAPEAMEKLFFNLIHTFKSSLKEKWSLYFNHFPEKLQIKLKLRFNIEE